MTPSKKEIQFIDTTIRDGNQSLWDATGLTTAMILSIAPVMDRVGFKAVDFITGTLMAVSVRWHKENPWEKIRLVCKAMEKTPLSFGGTGRRFMGWRRVPESIMALAMKLVITRGIRRVWLLDPSFDIDFILRQARMAKQAGAEEFVVPLSYTISPIHTDAFYAQKAAEIAASPDVDGIYTADPLKDPSAKKFDRITHFEVLNMRLEVMDATALSLCLENKLPIIVFDLQAHRSMEQVVLGEPIGTLVSSES